MLEIPESRAPPDNQDPEGQEHSHGSRQSEPHEVPTAVTAHGQLQNWLGAASVETEFQPCVSGVRTHTFYRARAWAYPQAERWHPENPHSTQNA